LDFKGVQVINVGAPEKVPLTCLQFSVNSTDSSITFYQFLVTVQMKCLHFTLWKHQWWLCFEDLHNFQDQDQDFSRIFVSESQITHSVST